MSVVSAKRRRAEKENINIWIRFTIKYPIYAKYVSVWSYQNITAMRMGIWGKFFELTRSDSVSPD